MTVFAELPLHMRALAGIGSFALCLAGSTNLVLSYKQRKRSFFACSLILLFWGTWTMQAVSIIAYGRSVGGFWGALTHLPAWSWAAGLSALLIVAAFVTRENLRWRKTHVTPLSIQESFEKLTEGLCYYRAGGQCILVNGKMNQICKELTGHVLLNGEEFSQALAQRALAGQLYFMLSDGKVYTFSGDEVEYEGEMLREIIATDVTEPYGKTELLRKENERLRAFQEELRAYNESMRESVKKEEILRAKMRIHDEMNRLLLTARNAIEAGDGAARQRVLEQWRNNAILLCKESENPGENTSRDMLKDLRVLARSLGMELSVNGTLGEQDDRTLNFMVMATREAVINAAKHGAGKTLGITMEAGEEICVTYVNPVDRKEDASKGKTADAVQGTRAIAADAELGQKHGEAVPETGGLGDLRRRLEAAGGSMETLKEGGEFRLRIKIPRFPVK